ncbi:MAG TPA: hypothetical protein VE155_10160 [Pseudonocardiaceae bacterium]|nr:hypothetical protein [Pseudonocardiaceae bacterium]
MNERALRKRCKRELRMMNLEPPLRVDVLCERLGERRGRPIRLVPYPLPVPGPFGLWLAAQRTDYIVFQAETSRPHQDHIILHEVGHVLANDESDDTDDEYWRRALPDLSPEMIQKALRRTTYDVDRERAAETVATIIMEWAARLARYGEAALDYQTPRRTDRDSVRRLERALADHQGWL